MDELKKAHARIAELERERAYLYEQSQAKDFVIKGLLSALNGQPLATEVPEFVKNLMPSPNEQTKGGEA